MTGSRAASMLPSPEEDAPPGSDSLSGHGPAVIHTSTAAEGQDSPQAKRTATPIEHAPAGNMTAPPARVLATPTAGSREGRTTSHGQATFGPQGHRAVAVNIPGGHPACDPHVRPAAGEQFPPATASGCSAPIADTPWLAGRRGTR